jgi:hypothetical protein
MTAPIAVNTRHVLKHLKYLASIAESRRELRVITLASLIFHMVVPAWPQDEAGWFGWGCSPWTSRQTNDRGIETRLH